VLGRRAAGPAGYLDRLRQFPGLLDCGRRRIAFLGHASNHYPEFFERYRGYRQALQDAAIEESNDLQVDAFTTEQSGYDAACSLLDRGAPFDGIFCASDLIAIGAMSALQERNLRVPDDVAVAGFDDIPTARFANPSLTTVHQDTKVAATLLVDSLLASIRGEAAESRSIAPSLVIRQSTGPLP
jgi:DNA-binding LacI/PurR family transcriptional regulator